MGLSTKCSVENATLNRFFSLHFQQPFIQAAQVIQHLFAQHLSGSNNPEGITSSSDKIRFHPYYTSKDLVGIVWLIQGYSQLVFFFPYYQGHPDNSVPANAMVTPHSIVPEWYFQPYYAIQRAIPDKMGGVIAMGSALLVQQPQPFQTTLNIRTNKYRPVQHFQFWVFVFNFFVLFWVGAKPVDEPYITIAQVSTVIYFGYFIVQFQLG